MNGAEPGGSEYAELGKQRSYDSFMVGSLRIVDGFRRQHNSRCS